MSIKQNELFVRWIDDVIPEMGGLALYLGCCSLMPLGEPIIRVTPVIQRDIVIRNPLHALATNQPAREVVAQVELPPEIQVIFPGLFRNFSSEVITYLLFQIPRNIIWRIPDFQGESLTEENTNSFKDSFKNPVARGILSLFVANAVFYAVANVINARGLSIAFTDSNMLIRVALLNAIGIGEIAIQNTLDNKAKEEGGL